MRRNISKLTVLIVTLFFCAFPAFAQKESVEIKQQRQCVEQINQQTAAFVAHDWEQLNRMAVKFIASCKDVVAASDLAGGYGYQAIALNNLGKPREALITAESCIDIYYSDSVCHLERVHALINLKKFSQVQDALDITERLVRHNLENAEKNLNSAKADDIEKELYQSEIKLFKSLLDKIETLKKESYSAR